MNLVEEIFKIADQNKSHIFDIRKTIHKNPELSFREYQTADFIRKELNKLGIRYQSLIDSDTVAFVGIGDNCVALRADIDALPIQEETDCAFRSANDGIMHACGHDMHTAMLLGAAKILKKIESNLNGTVMLIFQPGEEKLPGGAKLMIENGLFENNKPGAIFGQHVNPAEPSGNISLNSGYIMASADELYWTIKGKGAHAAQPHLGLDPIAASSQIIVQLQSMINKFRNPLEPAVLTVTSIHGGSATNIIPEEVKMMGTLRTFNNEVRFALLDEIKKISNQISSFFGCSCLFESPEGYPPLFNDSVTTDFISETASEIFGQDNVTLFEPKMWAEDFAYYGSMAKIPGTFWFLGVRPENTREMPGLHHPKFLPSEDAMIKGTAMLAASAAKFLNRR